MINLTDEDRLKLEYDIHKYIRKVDLSIGSYYAKYCHGEVMFGELLGKKIADIVGLKCPNYYICWDERCIISEDLRSINGFYMAEDLLIDCTTLGNIRECLEIQRDKFNKFTNVEELMFQVYMMHFVDILFSNIDRHNRNYGFILNEDGTGQLVIYDHGDLLTHLDKAARPLSFDKVGELDYTLYSKESEARYFFDNASKEVMTMIYSLVSAFTVRRVSMIMNLIEKEENRKFVCKKEYLKSYKKNYKMIRKLLLSREYMNKRAR